jgi:hypothetical protein
MSARINEFLLSFRFSLIVEVDIPGTQALTIQPRRRDLQTLLKAFFSCRLRTALRKHSSLHTISPDTHTTKKMCCDIELYCTPRYVYVQDRVTI